MNGSQSDSIPFRRPDFCLALFAALMGSWAASLAAPGGDVYYQSFKPRIESPIHLHRGAPCGNVGGVQQAEIMADRPRQAAMQALRNPRVAIEMADHAYSAAAEAELERSASCVDLYFETVAFSWHFVQSPNAAPHAEYPRAWQLYHSGLAKLIETATRFGRLQPDRGLLINTPIGTQLIRIELHGFVWKPADFNRINVVSALSLQNTLENHYTCNGLGVPLVITRKRTEDERFFLNETPFAATAVLRPSLAVLAGRAPPVGTPTSHGPLELYDPLRVATVTLHGQPVKLACDTSAAFELAKKEIQYNPIKIALNPGFSNAKEQLFMIEPYQRGKYPLVFIHGLLSSPQVWRNIANEVLARPDLRRQFQPWAFRYPTGKPFPESAAALRRELQAAVQQLDPNNNDPALYQMVLIGHSMGGLVAKLQVTSSGNTLWHSVANRPLAAIRASEKERDYLFRLFYFEPLPFVTRVVFIGTPHNGSVLASQAIGRCGAHLIQQPVEQTIEHQAMVKQNPGVFSPEVRYRIPSSIDLLEPDSEILHAIQQLCPGPNVQLHSIIGTGLPGPLAGPADGVVPVSSAQHPYVSTEKYVHTTHGKLHSDPESVEEIMCILRRHIWEASASDMPSCPLVPPSNSPFQSVLERHEPAGSVIHAPTGQP